MKIKAYRVRFRVRFYFGGVISYEMAHTSILAENEDDARTRFKELMQIGDATWDELKNGIEITKIELEHEFE